tara:strand:- start:883 stop:1779 length:897 start_codon:yes stop_codon:yes gene_type:complete
MYPILFKYKALEISSYGFMLMIAFLVCNYLLRRYMVQINENPKRADDIIFFAAIGGILGSKIYYIIEQIIVYADYSNIYGFINIFKGMFYFDLQLIFSGITAFGSGLVFLGGLIGGMLSVTIYVRKNDLSWLCVGDWVAPYLILGHAIGRIGCFLVGDCYGKPCALPWAVTFKNGLPPSTYSSFQYNYPEIFNQPSFQSLYSFTNKMVYVHPTQLYESLVYLLIFFYLIKIRRNKSYEGIVFFEYLFLAGISRFIIEFIRLNPKYIFNLSGAQFISLIMIVASSFFMYIYRKQSNREI